MVTALLLILVAVAFFYSMRINVRHNKEILGLLREMMEEDPKRKPIRSPNRLPKPDPDVTFFDENNPLTIPKNVKFEVEGGDMLEPYSYGGKN